MRILLVCALLLVVTGKGGSHFWEPYINIILHKDIKPISDISLLYNKYLEKSAFFWVPFSSKEICIKIDRKGWVPGKTALEKKKRVRKGKWSLARKSILWEISFLWWYNEVSATKYPIKWDFLPEPSIYFHFSLFLFRSGMEAQLMILPSNGILVQIMVSVVGTHLSITWPKFSCTRSGITCQNPTGANGFKIYQR